MKKQLESARLAKDHAETKVGRLEADLKSAEDRHVQLEERNTRLCKSLEEVHRAMAQQDARKRRDRLALDCVRLGKIVSMRMGVSVQDVWEEGYALNEMKRRTAELLERKEELEKRKKKLQNMKRAAKKGSKTAASASAAAASSAVSSSNMPMSAPELPGEGADADPYEVDLDLSAEEEAIKTHLDQLKKDETALQEERRMLEGEKAAHQKEIKRCQSEDRSRFSKNLPCLHGRYLLLSMLGRGGFSEVWKALDLAELRDVAVKIHELNPTWSEEHKQRYIKNVTREYKIHREMRHPRVVEFYDVFEIDVNSFATVLEYCKGIDLDEKLKRCRVLPEREARTILMQIVSGLRYLNTPGDGGGEDGNGDGTRRKAIIHYDLKPANILFDEHGDAKITDFGLSKIIEETHEGTSMELTSQGAGTYWYLPPECFGAGDARISSKVDVWSVGVIFYQMLFGRKPFGEGKRQESVLSEGIIRNATKVEFPSNDPRAPKITEEAKEFIRACLEVDQRYRPHVHELCHHAYLKNGSK
jgi:tousled-like kinase